MRQKFRSAYETASCWWTVMGIEASQEVVCLENCSAVQLHCTSPEDGWEKCDEINFPEADLTALTARRSRLIKRRIAASSSQLLRDFQVVKKAGSILSVGMKLEVAQASSLSRKFPVPFRCRLTRHFLRSSDIIKRSLPPQQSLDDETK